MCGIAGLINCGDRHVLARMTDSLAHRGPDDKGLEWFEPARSGLGHRRLSIIDLSPAGHQPMSSEDGSLWITFNGEIYNHADIRRELETNGHRFRSSSDTEVLLKAFQEWGAQCLDRLNGMFAFAIFDERSNKLFAARDRLGVKPFYYHHNQGAFLFSSEIKALLSSGLVDKQPDYTALHTPARFQISPLTGFKDVYKLPPAHYLTFETGDLTIHRYWSIRTREDPPSSDADTIEQLDGLLKDAARLQMISDVPVGVFLSGGVDSSLISALVRANTAQQVHSFTIKFSDKDQKFEKMPRDEVYARQVAEQFDFRFHEFELNPDIATLFPKLVWHLDEPLADPAAINTYLISQAARDSGIIVLLNGMGGDEIFGGYRKQLACLKAELYQTFVPAVVRHMLERLAQAVPVAHSRGGLRTVRWTKRFLSFASMPQTMRYLMSDLSVAPDQFSTMFCSAMAYEDTHFYQAQQATMSDPQLSYVTRMCLNDTQVFLPEHNLTYSDKASMAAGIESRPPLTDHRVVEFLFSLAPRYRIRGNVQKFLLKKVAARYLPYRIVHRPKAPFWSPLRSWLRGPLAEMVSDLLSYESLKKRGLYEPAYVAQLIARDRAGLEDNSHVIWTLLTNEVWFRVFFDAALPLPAQLREREVATCAR
jgi:asparagine synthase (glutamine-hydrolysing)